ncbi:PREDICTED: RAD9, HUS1, RAD1-interacting nuclear orphan protein 1 isoform X2 [Rhinopithecus bieti]|uniref:RAD9, HUS1, RAD1-interacting nuclear orphan protein 1 isoform X2 n=1 Tax=Rhinopithecus bieti TaxID=61621 RepID=UPI00083C157E|nr:PREDICTED: RAD9, HUS1, RAD1-interacting nuclear orphan protein 1 isoform X2 [Rhinopithecus bieti]
MPPRKKRRQPSQKAQLLFHHQPLEGPKHSCASTQLPITHTRQVSPDFDTTAGSLLPAYRKHHHQYRARHSSRKSTTSKFPHLTFESPQSSNSETLGIPLIRECLSESEKDVSRRPLVSVLSPQSCGDMSAQALQSLPYVFIPPDIQTPESSSVKEELIPRDQKENSLPSCSLHTGTPDSPEPGPVLVEDTPEDKYGIKVTWRRRQHLLAYLRERGKLSRSQFLVKS